MEDAVREQELLEEPDTPNHPFSATRSTVCRDEEEAPRSQGPATSYAKNYCFTSYGPFTNIIDLLDNGLPDNLHFFTGQFERSPTTNHAHFQGYVQFKRAARGIRALQQIVGPAHVEVARGSPADNIKYCNKEDSRLSGPFTLGTPITQGQRTDIEMLKQDIKAGMPMGEIAEKHFAFALRYGPAISRLQNLLSVPVHQEYTLSQFIAAPVDLTTSVLIYGPTKMGKTHFALAHFTNPLLVRHMDDFANLSSKNDGIVIDELEFRHLPSFAALINLTDLKFKCSVHVRYTVAHIPAGMRRIFTAMRPDIFEIDGLTSDQRAAIARRVRTYRVTTPLYQLPDTPEMTTPVQSPDLLRSPTFMAQFSSDDE